MHIRQVKKKTIKKDKCFVFNYYNLDKLAQMYMQSNFWICGVLVQASINYV